MPHRGSPAHVTERIYVMVICQTSSSSLPAASHACSITCLHPRAAHCPWYMEAPACGRVCMQEQVQELAWQLGESQRYTEEAKRNGEQFKADNERLSEGFEGCTGRSPVLHQSILAPSSSSSLS